MYPAKIYRTLALLPVLVLCSAGALLAQHFAGSFTFQFQDYQSFSSGTATVYLMPGKSALQLTTPVGGVERTFRLMALAGENRVLYYDQYAAVEFPNEAFAVSPADMTIEVTDQKAEILGMPATKVIARSKDGMVQETWVADQYTINLSNYPLFSGGAMHGLPAGLSGFPLKSTTTASNGFVVSTFEVTSFNTVRPALSEFQLPAGVEIMNQENMQRQIDRQFGVE